MHIFHKWDKWSKPEILNIKWVDSERETSWYIQEHECIKCLKVKRRRVR